MLKDSLQGRTDPAARRHCFSIAACLQVEQLADYSTNRERTGRAILLRLHHPASAEVHSKQLLSCVDTTYLHTEPCTDTVCKGSYASTALHLGVLSEVMRLTHSQWSWQSCVSSLATRQAATVSHVVLDYSNSMLCPCAQHVLCNMRVFVWAQHSIA